MIYALIGDFHGIELKDLKRNLGYINPDVLISLGDKDQVRTINQFEDLKKEYEKAGKIVIDVLGNHDDIILNNIGILSSILEKQGKTSIGLHEELKDDPMAHKYLSDLVNTKDTKHTIFLDESKFGKIYQTIIMHGAYDGFLPKFCRKEPNLWAGLKTQGDYEKNFKVMAEKGDKIMIRGHDHDPAYAYEDANEGCVIKSPLKDSLVFALSENRLHTINPGALFDGYFATINTGIPGRKTPILGYHRL